MFENSHPYMPNQISKAYNDLMDIQALFTTFYLHEILFLYLLTKLI